MTRVGAGRMVVGVLLGAALLVRLGQAVMAAIGALMMGLAGGALRFIAWLAAHQLGVYLAVMVMVVLLLVAGTSLWLWWSQEGSR